VYFPDERTIATGDLFLNNSCPAMDEGDLVNWIRALDFMLQLPLDHVVPGHFALATKVEMGEFRSYMADLRDQVLRMHDKGKSLAQIQESLHMNAHKTLRQFPQYEATFKDNAAAYYAQLQRRQDQK